MMLTNVILVPTNVTTMPPVPTMLEAMTAHVMPDILVTEDNAPTLMNVTLSEHVMPMLLVKILSVALFVPVKLDTPWLTVPLMPHPVTVPTSMNAWLQTNVTNMQLVITIMVQTLVLA
jgi:hypothetical protein